MTKKKSFWTAIVAFCLIVPAMFVMTACKKDKHAHTFSNEWSKNEEYHWYEATCEHTNEKDSYGKHTFGEWTTKTPANHHQSEIQKRTCDKCGFEETRPVEDSALHDYNYEEYKSDETGHWFECSCGKRTEFEEHKYNDWSEKTPAGVDQDRQLSRTCSDCGHEETLTFDNTKTNGKYCMAITDVIKVSGGKIIRVKVLRGTFSVGDNLSVAGVNGTFEIKEIRKQSASTTLTSATYGQEVDLVLAREDGVLDDIDTTKRGCLMFEPNTVKSYKTFTAQIKFLEKDDDKNVGMNTPIGSGNSFDIVLNDGSLRISGTITFSAEKIMPGETHIVTITLDSETAFLAGMDFSVNHKTNSRKIIEGIIFTVENEQ